MTVVPMDRLTAMSRWKVVRWAPSVWIPDSRYLVEPSTLRSGRGVATCSSQVASTAPVPLPLHCFVGPSESRDEALRQKYGSEISWSIIHDAALGGWLA